jgi:glycosyltransferase involved in cell wall biosynthesis
MNLLEPAPRSDAMGSRSIMKSGNPTILFAPVLKAENWLSIDLHRSDTLAAFAKMPDWDVKDITPKEHPRWGEIGRRVTRDFLYPLHVRRMAQRQMARTGVRPIVHVIDHSYGHLCAAWHPTVVTCHDLNHFVRPTLSGVPLFLWRARVRTMKRAAHIFTNSEQVAGEVRQHLQIPDDRITVAGGGLDHAVFKPLPREACAAAFPELAHLSQTHRLVLHVGTNIERKNLPTLLRAIAHLKRKGQTPVKLLKVGHSLREDGFTQMIRDLGIEEEVIELGKPARLTEIYNLVDVLSFPSLYEGFGRPTLEAQACGLPCVLADSSCMKEVGGDGALYHEGTNHEQLAAHLETVLCHPDVRENLVRLGFENAARFTWEAHVRKLTEVYSQLHHRMS